MLERAGATMGDEASQNQDASAANEIRVLNVVLALAQNARLLIVVPLAAGVLALAASFLITPTFTATARILPPSAQQSALGSVMASQLGAWMSNSSLGILGARSLTEVYVAMLRTRTVGERMIDRFKLTEWYGTKSREIARRRLETASRIDLAKGGLIVIEVEDRDPRQAAEIANGFVQELMRLSGELAITDAQQRRVFFEKQMQKTQESLRLAEADLRKTGASESLVKSSPQIVVEGIAKLKANIAALEIKIASMRTYLTDASPELQMAFREISALREQVRRAEQDQPTQAKDGGDYLDKFRNYKYQETLYDLMARQLELARLDELREGALIQVVDVAQPPEFKSAPRRSIIAVVTTLAAGLLLFVFVLVRETMRIAEQQPQSAHIIAQIIAALRDLRHWKLPRLRSK